jgi:hypothetical protein
MTEVNMSEAKSKREEKAEQLLDAAMATLIDTTKTPTDSDVVMAAVAVGKLALDVLKFEHEENAPGRTFWRTVYGNGTIDLKASSTDIDKEIK